MSDAAEKPAHRPISEHDIEVLLASANAIQRLIDERNALRNHVDMLEDERNALRNHVDMLERELARLRDQTTLYRRLTGEFISQIQLVEGFRGPAESAGEIPAEETAGTRVTWPKSV
jgi:predicted nuclease with TOPRIM domain